SLILKGEKGRVELSRAKGHIEVNWLQGVLRADGLDGHASFDLPAGNAQLKKVRGKLKAKGHSTDWRVQAAAPTDVEVVSESGPVHIQWTGGGTKLFLSSAS